MTTTNSTPHKREIIKIDKTVEDEAPDAPPKLKKVAAYARVSTEMEAQQSSLALQRSYYESYIRSKPDWEFVGIYADDGASGTDIKNRHEFNRMLADAHAGKIDLILTKSISRFARNTVHALQLTRELRDDGIEVFFEKENISSMDRNAELLFTILSSAAQDESRSISENVTWGKHRSMEAGKISLAWSNFLGYRKGPDGLPEIIPEEAELVREIFALFLKEKSFSTVAKILNERGYVTKGKKRSWYADGVKRVLTNEKYVGDARLGKTYTVDYLTKEVRKNTGQSKQWYITDSHDAIVSRRTFNRAQEIMKHMTVGKVHKSPFTGKLFCGICGAPYGHRITHPGTSYESHSWRCRNREKGKCTGPILKEEFLLLNCPKKDWEKRVIRATVNPDKTLIFEYK